MEGVNVDTWVTQIMQLISGCNTKKQPLETTTTVPGHVNEYAILLRMTNATTGDTLLVASHGTTWQVAYDAIQQRCERVLLDYPQIIAHELQCVITTASIYITRETTEEFLINVMVKEESEAMVARDANMHRKADHAVSNAKQRLNAP